MNDPADLYGPDAFARQDASDDSIFSSSRTTSADAASSIRPGRLRGRAARPEDDPHIGETALSDPIYAVYAERSGGDPARPSRPEPVVEWPVPWDAAEVRRRTATIRETMTCPHCGESLTAWEPPDGPFSEWDRGLYHVCFNDRCPFLIRGFDAMARQGNLGYSCRILYDRERDRFRPIPVNGMSALRSGIRTGEGTTAR